MRVADEKDKLIRLLLRAGAIEFGDFTDENGHRSPYFFDLGKVNSATSLFGLSNVYVNFIMAEKNIRVENIYGVSHKSVPIAVLVAMQLTATEKREIGFFYNCGEMNVRNGNGFVGLDKNSAKSVVIIEDILTSGLDITDSLTRLADHNIYARGIFVAIDRQEKGTTDKSARKEIEDLLGVKIIPILTMDEVVELLYKKRIMGRVWIDEDCYNKIKDYRSQYGGS